MIGKQVGQYRLEQALGEGGFGTVYRGVHVHVGTIEAAVKVAHPNLAHDPLFVKLVQRECQILYSLSHPKIVTFRDLLVEDGTLAVVMELMLGQDLFQRLEAGPVDRATALHIIESMLEGLAHAHQLGIVHRDIKPANVFLCSDGQVKLMDFGIAKAASSTQATRSGMVSGTVDYMAPERFSGESSPAVDIYAVGLVAWELLTGQRACPEGDLPSKLGWHLKQGAPPVLQACPDCPAWLSDEVASWCHLEPGERPADAGEALQRLGNAASSAGEQPFTAESATPGPRPPTSALVPPPRPRRTGRGWLWLALPALLLLLLGVSGVGFLAIRSLLSPGPQQPQRPQAPVDVAADPISGPATPEPPVANSPQPNSSSPPPTAEPEPEREPEPEPESTGPGIDASLVSLREQEQAFQLMKVAGTDGAPTGRRPTPARVDHQLERKASALDALERAVTAVVDSDDPDASFEALTMLTHAQRGMAETLWQASEHPQLQADLQRCAQQRQQARERLSQAIATSRANGAQLADHGLRDERWRELSGFTAELQQQLAGWQHEPGPEREPEHEDHDEPQLLEALAGQLPEWEERLARLEPCGSARAQRAREILGGALEQAHQVLEQGRWRDAEGVMGQLEQAAPSVEAALESCP